MTQHDYKDRAAEIERLMVLSDRLCAAIVFIAMGIVIGGMFALGALQ